MKLNREEKKKIILGIIHESFHMDVSRIDDNEVTELILKVCEI